MLILRKTRRIVKQNDVKEYFTMGSLYKSRIIGENMKLGDYIRQMDDKQLADILINSITANSDCFEEYRVDFGGYLAFNVIDADDLAEKLGEIEVEHE